MQTMAAFCHKAIKNYPYIIIKLNFSSKSLIPSLKLIFKEIGPPDEHIFEAYKIISVTVSVKVLSVHAQMVYTFLACLFRRKTT